MGREDDIRIILELGRRTRTPTPRWLWIAAVVIGAVCAVCFTAMMLGGREPPSQSPGPGPSARPSHPVEQRPGTGSGLGLGLMIGTGVGLVIGFSIGRQRLSHSSRRRP